MPHGRADDPRSAHRIDRRADTRGAMGAPGRGPDAPPVVRVRRGLRVDGHRSDSVADARELPRRGLLDHMVRVRGRLRDQDRARRAPPALHPPALVRRVPRRPADVPRAPAAQDPRHPAHPQPRVPAAAHRPHGCLRRPRLVLLHLLRQPRGARRRAGGPGFADHELRRRALVGGGHLDDGGLRRPVPRHRGRAGGGRRAHDPRDRAPRCRDGEHGGVARGRGRAGPHPPGRG